MRTRIEHQRHNYAIGLNEFGYLSIPEGDGLAPVVILVHGGFWRAAYGHDLMDPLAEDLVDQGYAVWNIEYARVGQIDGGWPNTLGHVAAAVDHLAVLAETEPIDLERVAIVGHSAGGHLAAWVGGRDRLPDGALGAAPRVSPVLAIGQGAVIDMFAAGEDGLGRNAVVDLLGGSPSEQPDRYAIAQPINGIARVVLVNGDQDTIVPAAYSGRDDFEATTVTVAGADHFDLIDPDHAAWAAAVAALDAL